ncbi:MAG: hypothetical protein J6U13_06875 [Salinivirgaceae bacterium]|nr:hypothetical protein [Salinivirgaceae bacterium]MBR5168046.1 hypothetical protein [Salinivirgaceae bacterium]
MRTIHKLCAICIMLLLGAVNSYGQCDQAFIDKCSQTSATIKYVKHFRIRFTEAMKGKSISEGKFAIMLNKGSHYRFFTCNDETKPGHTVVELANESSVLVANINASTGAEYPAFDFICSKTGPYFLKMHFKDGKEGCGVCVMTLVTN